MRKKIVKILPVFIAAAMCGGIVAGCTGNNGNNGGGGGGHIYKYEDCEDGVNHLVTCETCDEVEYKEAHTYAQHKVTCDYCNYHNPVATTLKGWDGTDNGFTDDHVSQIYVVGDSTVCDYNLSPQKFDNDRFLPRYGYGTQLHEYLNYTSDKVVNLAISGRSAVSLMGEANYQTLVNSIGEGDYLIIGFGHNDEKREPNRFGDPEGKIDEPVTDRGDSWKYILNENYIKLAKHRGATPIICTPIVRYDAKGAYAGNYIHDTDYGDYPAALKALGEETDTTVIDLTTLTKNTWIAAGDDAAYFHSVGKYAGAIVNAPYGASVLPDFDSIDGTHINKYGAKMVAYQLANALKATSLSSIVRSDITAPVKSEEYVGAINQSYTKSDYTSFDPGANEANLVTDGWYKTAFGDLGGQFSANNLTATHNNGKFTVAYAGKGKIASNADGLAAIFKQIAIDEDFSISVHAKITSFDSSLSVKQAAFGIMLRDDIHINKSDAALKSDYVTAGVLTNENKNGDANNDTAAFSRSGGSQGKGKTLGADIANGSEFNLTMTKTGTTISVTIEMVGGNTVTETFTDPALGSVDSDYVYLCLFANRGITVEYTNVNYTNN